MKKCVRCGFCCTMEQCFISQEIHGYVNECPELKWDGKKYSCDLVGKNDRVNSMIGEGCGVSWNRWRNDVKKRGRRDYEHYLSNGMLKDISKGM